MRLTTALMAALAATACGSSSSNPTSFTLTGTLTKSGVADGVSGYVKLVSPGGAATEAPIYYAVATFSGGKATYKALGVATGSYSGWAFIDINGNAKAASPMPDTGDWATPSSASVTMDADKTLDVADASWMKVQ